MATNNKGSKVTEKEVLKMLGAYSALALYLLLLILTFAGGVNYPNIVNEIIQLVTGDVASIKVSSETMVETILNIISVVVITIPIVMVAGKLTRGNTKSFDVSSIDKMLDNGPFTLFFVVAIEEIVTRGIFLGLLTKVFTGDLGFYAMFLLGNALWAFVHIYNYKDKNERSILYVAPQFIGGITLTYVYVRYGLFAAISAHYLYNSILLATLKENLPDSKIVFTFFYYLMIFLVSLFMMTNRGLGITDLLPWVNEDAAPLVGFEFWDYALVLVVFDAIIGIIATILLLDTVKSSRDLYEEINSKGTLYFIVFAIAYAMAKVGLILLLNWLFGFIIGSVIVRSIVITIVLAMLAKSHSGSSLANATLLELPSCFLSVAAFVALDFWSALGLSLVFFLVHYLPLYVNSD